MRSVLEFLNETEKLINDDSAIQRSPYASTAVTRLKTYRMKLKELFDKSPDDENGLQTLLAQANTIALQLEYHLSRVDGTYLEKYKRRQEASTLFKEIKKSLLTESVNRDENNIDSDIVNLVKLADFIHKYYIRSEFYVWDLDKEDKVMLALARDYVEERTYGNSGVSNSVTNDGNVISD